MQAKISVRDLDFYYGYRQALFEVSGSTVRSYHSRRRSSDHQVRKIHSARCLNRMNDLWKACCWAEWGWTAWISTMRPSM